MILRRKTWPAWWAILLMLTSMVWGVPAQRLQVSADPQTDQIPASSQARRGRLSNAVCLSGTYQLDTARSDNPDRVADAAARWGRAAERERIRNLIRRRLEPPEMLGLDRRGRTISMASSNAPLVTFNADGQTRVEERRQGRTIRVRAGIYGDRLIINRTGERGREYYAMFDPLEGCRWLRVTRRVTVPGLARRITLRSMYVKTDEVAQWDRFRGRRGFPDRVDTGGGYYVPTGTQLNALLNRELSTARAQVGDRFTLTVESPSRFQGALIDARVADVDRAGRVSGRSEIGFDFDSIRLRTGSLYDFAGYVEAVRTPDGKIVRVDNEGSLRERSQTGRTVERAGIGAAIGAVIGAVIEGLEGAAIGAAIGAGAGAGSVVLQGRDDLELDRGTQFTIRATSVEERAANR